MEKCGFAFHDHFQLWQKNKIASGNTGPDMEVDPDFWLLNFSRQRIGVELKSLHQLQNVFFFLKGKELEITDGVPASSKYAPAKKSGTHTNVLTANSSL